MPSLDIDWRLQLAAFNALRQLRDAGGGVVRLGAALSVATTPAISLARFPVPEAAPGARHA